MFEDDRMMSILSGVVLMVAIGTVIQQSDRLRDWFGGAPSESRLIADEQRVEANNLAMIDVLANDLELDGGAAGRLVVTAEPRCGRVFVQNGVMQYLADESCVGAQRFIYGIRGSGLEPAVVRLSVLAPKDRPATTGTPPAPVPEPAADDRSLGALARAEPAPEAPALPQPSSDEGLAVTTRSSAGAAVAALPPRALPVPDGGASGAEGLGASAPGAPAHGTAPAAPAPEARRPEPPAIGGADSIVRSAGPAPTEGATPAGLDPAAPAEAVARLPAPVVPRADASALPLPDAPGPDESGTLRGAMPAPSGAPARHAAGTRAAPAARPGDAAAAPAAPRPRGGAAPDLPGAPETDGEIRLAAAPDRTARSGGTPEMPRPPAAVEPAGRAPDRLDRDPAADDPLETGGARLPGAPPGLVAVAAGDASPPAGPPPSTTRPAPAERSAPEGAAGAMTGIARASLPQAVAAPGTAAPTVAGRASAASGIEPAQSPAIAAGAPSGIALAAPASAPGAAGAPGPALALAPVDASQPPLADTPEPDPETAAARPLPEGTADGEDARLAALPPADADCVVPPAVSLDPGRAAITDVHVVSPCHAGTAAVLDYGELSLGIALGPDGKGSLAVPGFESDMQATLTFADDTPLAFMLPFEEIEKVERVALVWDMPVRLNLHALEFGATAGGADHVRPDNPRSLEAVRRSGGGFLTGYAPVAGAGRHASVYTFYVRQGGPSGVVEMLVDFTSRRAAEAGTCGEGERASPGFTVVRTVRGMPERPARSRLAARACGTAEPPGEGMIANAVGDLVIAR